MLWLFYMLSFSSFDLWWFGSEYATFVNTHTSLVVPLYHVKYLPHESIKGIVELFPCDIFTSYMTIYVWLCLDYIVGILCGNCYLLDGLHEVMLLCNIQMCWFFVSCSSHYRFLGINAKTCLCMLLVKLDKLMLRLKCTLRLMW